MKISTLFISTLLSMSAMTANAFVIVPIKDITGATVDNSTNFADSVSLTTAEYNALPSSKTISFSDVVNFDVPTSNIADLYGAVTIKTYFKNNVLTPTATFNSVSLFDSNNHVVSLSSSNGQYSASNLQSGAYTLRFDGYFTPKPFAAGTYSARFDGHIDLSLTPVPEPESYSMILAGLGLMGFVAARRKV